MVMIVLAGTDGSGKGTQTAMLAEHFRAKGKTVEVFDFPDYESFFGQLIAKYLRGELGPVQTISPYLSGLLYAQDRWLKKEALRKACESADLVICNRYVEANLAHQAIKLPQKEQPSFIQWIEKLEYEIFGLPQPDLTLFLDVPPHYNQQLIKQKQSRAYLAGQTMDEHEKDTTHAQKAYEIYHRLAQKKDWIRISCLKDNTLLKKEEILQMILQTLKERFPEL